MRSVQNNIILFMPDFKLRIEGKSKDEITEHKKKTIGK